MDSRIRISSLYRKGSKPHSLSFLSLTFFLLCVAMPDPAHAQTISGVIHDPSGAVVTGAQVEISGGDLAQPLALLSDGVGRFTSPTLKAGAYSVRVTRDGFESLLKTVELKESVQLDLTLTIAKEVINISVPAKSLAYANSDPVYRQLRDLGTGQTYRFDNFTLNWDVGTFLFQAGTLTFLSPVNGVVTGAIFIGVGHFTLTPATPLNVRELNRRTGTSEVSEDFTQVIFRFTAGGRLKFMPGIGAQTDTPSDAASALSNWKEKVRKRREEALSFTQYLLEGETIDNVDADVLAAIYNRSHPEFFNAYLRGKKHKDLRFFVRTRVGALPQLDSPEEVALINYDVEGMSEGIWYLAHLQTEYANHMASSVEERRLFATHRYKIETVIAKNKHLFSTATITFEALIPGERVMKFGLLPNLRVTRVRDELGQNLYFVQEGRKEDGSFYAILPQAAAVGKEQVITIDYEGDKVLEEAGEGSFYVGARTSWYPNLNGFGERALYDLTFRVPRKYKVISVGALQGESIEQDLEVTHWITPIPVAVAGFNYGEYKKLDMPDQITNYRISGYYLSELPNNLRGYRALASMAPGSMTKYALEQTRAQLELCTVYFGRIPYTDISITEQPNFNFGQSWPNLVYLPISAYTDSTQRWMLFGSISSKLSGFVQEVTPHEVAHQWWGHAVGWASYHDQWLSEGFAEFSAGLFLQQAVAGDWRSDYIEFWERLRQRVLEKNNYGTAPNDAGPIWMGLRLISPRTESAYQHVTYAKGAYVLQMLRSMMYSAEDKDKAFIDMMHDFVASHQDRPASTESFKAIAEKHIPKAMNLEGNGRLDWFFKEWVYGTDIPKYHFDYQLGPEQNGKVKLHMVITQSEVENDFAMLVPVFADFGKGMARLGQIPIIGNSTQTIDTELPAKPKKVVLNAYKEILER